MAISLKPAEKYIYVPKSYLTVVSAPYYYTLDMEQFRLDLRDLEDDEENNALMRTHDRNAPLEVGGITLAQQVIILPPWLVEFEEDHYQVTALGANHNVGDRRVFNSVSFNPNLSAGLLQVVQGSGITDQDKTDIVERMLKYNMSSITGEAAYSLVNVLRKVGRNRVEISGGKLTVYKEDGVSVAYQQDVVFDEAQQPVKSLTP